MTAPYSWPWNSNQSIGLGAPVGFPPTPDAIGVFSLVTAPAEEPVGLLAAKTHLRIDADDTTQDALVAGLIQAARETVELHTRRALVRQTWDYFAPCFPYANRPLMIGKPPLLSVTSVKYVASDGTLTTVDPSTYSVNTASIDGSIHLVPGYNWPVPISHQWNAVQIRFVAGYGDAPAVPASLGAAMLLLVGHLYENREAVAGIQMAQLPLGVDALLGPFRYLTAA